MATPPHAYACIFHKALGLMPYLLLVIQSLPVILLLHGRIASRHDLVRGRRDIKHTYIYILAIYRQLALVLVPVYFIKHSVSCYMYITYHMYVYYITPYLVIHLTCMISCHDIGPLSEQ